MPKQKTELRQSDVIAVQGKLAKMESSFARDFNLLGGTTERNASMAAKELQSNITTQKFAGDYEPLKPGYLAWKRARGLSQKFWIRLGELFSAITRFKSGRGWVAGIPDGTMNSQGKDIAGYAKINEARRPLFAKTASEIDPSPSANNPVQGWAKINWVKSVARIIKLTWR